MKTKIILVLCLLLFFTVTSEAVEKIYFQPSLGIVPAYCTNGPGDGAIIQAAVNTGKPVNIIGPCVLDAPITVHTPGQEIFGDGQRTTMLTQSSVLSGGSFICATAEPGPQFHDFGIIFTQPDTTVRANLTAYNPAFSCRATPRARFQRLYMQAAMVALDIQGNSGGDYIIDNEVSAFNASVLIDGSVDTVRVERNHFWPFGLTANQTQIYLQTGTPSSSGGIGCAAFPGTVGICTGRMDDLKLSSNLFIMGGPQLYGFTGSGGPGGSSWSPGTTIGTGSNNSFDSNSGILWDQAGSLSLSASYFTEAGNNYAIFATSGSINVTGSYFLAGAPTTSYPVYASGGNINITGSTVLVSSASTPFAIAQLGGALVISDNQFSFVGGTAFSGASIIAGLTGDPFLTVTNNQMLTPVTSGTFLSVGAGVISSLRGNIAASGWTSVYTGPGGP